MSEGVHSVVDTGNPVLLLYGMRQAAKPLTPDHPFGYGLRLYFRAFVVAILIFGLGAGLSIVNCIDKIRTPHAIEDAWLNYSVLGLGMVFEGGVWWVAFRAFREEMGERGDVPFNVSIFTTLGGASLAGIALHFSGVLV